MVRVGFCWKLSSMREESQTWRVRSGPRPERLQRQVRRTDPSCSAVDTGLPSSQWWKWEKKSSAEAPHREWEDWSRSRLLFKADGLHDTCFWALTPDLSALSNVHDEQIQRAMSRLCIFDGHCGRVAQHYRAT